MQFGDLSHKEMIAGRALASEDLYFFTRWMFLARKNYAWERGPHHGMVCQALEDVFYGREQYIIINIPPRYSKTELAVTNFVPWALGKVPDAEFILTSYSASLATNNAFQARELLTHEEYGSVFPGTTLRSDSAAKAEWRTSAGGIVFATGVGGPCTGYGAGKMRPGFGGAIIIDDPHKADEARSDTMRNNVIEWYQNTLQSRRNSKETPVIVIMQRLHEKDLAGWLANEGMGHPWKVIHLPALAEENDALGRAVGEPLWPYKHSAEDLRTLETASPYMFSGQYQQRPSAAEGLVFKPDNIGILEALPAETIRWVRGWDFAGSVPKKGSKGGTSDPDYTVGLRLGKRPNGRYIIADVTRMRGTPDKVEECLINTTKRDGRSIYVDIPQDPGQAGKSQTFNFTTKLAGYRVSSSPESGDKITRAEGLAAQVNVGNVDMLKADWNDLLISEMRMFPNGAHDDQVDAASRAFMFLTSTKKLPPVNPATVNKA